MGAKYEYLAAFRYEGTDWNWHNLVTVGFGELWARFGPPWSLSVQNYALCTVDEGRYSAEGIQKVLPPHPNELVFAYSRPMGLCSVMFQIKEGYLLVSAAVEAQELNDSLKPLIFNQLAIALRPLEPSVLIAGEELEVSPSLLDTLEMSRSHLPKGLEVDLVKIYPN